MKSRPLTIDLSSIKEPQKLVNQRTSTFLAKKLFEPHTPTSPLSCLEKQIKTKLSKPKLIRFASKKPSPQISANSSPRDHVFSNQSPKILNLPKLPYGKHINYNAENDFVRQHFVKDDDVLTTEQIESIQKIEKYERKKIRALTKKSSPVTGRTKRLGRREEYKSEGGRLFVESKCSVLHNYYNKEKRKYSPEVLRSSVKDIDLNQNKSCSRKLLPLDISKLDMPFMF